jgi:hypothetical protein
MIIFMGSTAGRPLVRALLILAAVIAPGTASAADLYVNNSGSPACSNSTPKARNSAAAPWCDFGRAVWGSAERSRPNAAEAAAAGDTVHVTPGTYATSHGAGRDETDMTYKPVNSGAAGRPITFQCAAITVPATCVLTYRNASGVMLGTNGQHHIVFRGFFHDEATATAGSMGAISFRDCTGCRAEYNTLIGNPRYAPEGENHPGIFLLYATDILIADNTLSGWHCCPTQGNRLNGNAIEVYASGRVVIEHNTIHASGSGIFLKAPGDDPTNRDNTVDRHHGFFTLRANLLYGMERACIVTHRNPGTADKPTTIVQNICRDSGSCFQIRHFDGGNTDPAHSYWVNNVCHRWSGTAFDVANAGPPPAQAGHRIRNNIFRAGANVVCTGPAASELVRANFDWDLNWYSRYEVFGNRECSTRGDFGAWLEATEFDDGTKGRGWNGADPQFTNEATGVFTLRPGSKARNACPDVLDLDGDGSAADMVDCGAYVTGTEVIGVRPPAHPGAAGKSP